MMILNVGSSMKRGVSTVPSQRLCTKSTLFKVLATLFVVWNLLDVCLIFNASQSSQQQQELISPPQSPDTTIASLHYGNALLLRGYWNDAIAGLGKILVPPSVYVGAHDSASSDVTRDDLLRIAAQLGRRSDAPGDKIQANEVSEDREFSLLMS